MGLRMFLFAPALVIMLISIIVGGGNQNASGNLQTNSQNTQASFCANGAASGCVSSGTVTVVTCNNSLTPCKILPSCAIPTPAPAWCFPWPLSLIPSNAGTWLNPGATVILSAASYNSGLTASQAIFAFGSIGAQGFIGMIIIAVGIASLASISILNSGMGSEGVFILVMGGLAVGIWGFLSIMDGFITGNPASLFSGLNAIKLTGQVASAGLGTILYIICTLLWTFGFMGLVGRGA